MPNYTIVDETVQKKILMDLLQDVKKSLYFNKLFIIIMVNKTKILSDLSKMAVDAMGSFSSIKKELETIVKLRVDKAINKMNLVKREEFEVLKKTVQKLAQNNEILKKPRVKKKASNLKKKKKNMRKSS
tara:strand:- start:152 stop:538 length:387 start_codon:yes stop_codon:yes gene_type:complete